MLEIRTDNGRGVMGVGARLRMDLRGVRSEMKGLNPNTSSYKLLQQKERSIEDQLARLAAKVCPECQFEAPRYPHEKTPHQKGCSRDV